MATKVILPKLGLTMQEGVIEEWIVAAGTLVNAGDILMRIGTDKVDADVEAEESGRFHPAVPAGVTLPPGALVGWLLEEGEEPPGDGTPQTAVLGDVNVPQAAPGVLADVVPAAASPVGSLASNGSPTSNGNGAGPSKSGRLKASPNAKRVARERRVDLTSLRGSGPGGRIVSEDVEEALEAAAQAAQQAPQAPPKPAAPPAQAQPQIQARTQTAGCIVSPLVRRYADELGVDLAAVTSSGNDGRIRRTDIDAALAKSRGDTAGAVGAAGSTSNEPTLKPAGPQAGQVIAMTGMRGAIARNMHASLQEMAQLTHGYEADVSELVALREQLKAVADAGSRVPGLNDFLVKAAALALVRHPLLNATVREDGIHLLEEINIGFAAAVPDGLVVPVLRGADRRSLGDLARESSELAGAARSGRLTLPQMEGATFSVSSLGGYGVDFFTPVVSPGNVAILGVGRIRDGVRWEEEVPVRARVLTLSLTFDHRAVDGAPAAEFLRTVRDFLARPLLLLAG